MESLLDQTALLEVVVDELREVLGAVLDLPLGCWRRQRLAGPGRLAGGPVVVEEEGQPEVVADSPRSGWIVPVVVGLVVLCAIACGNDDEVAPN